MIPGFDVEPLEEVHIEALIRFWGGAIINSRVNSRVDTVIDYPDKGQEKEQTPMETSEALHNIERVGTAHKRASKT